MNKLQQIQDKKLAVAFHGWRVSAARNAMKVQTGKILTLWNVPNWSLLPATLYYALQCGPGGYEPPDDYDSFVSEVQEYGKRVGQDLGLDLVSHELPEMARQLREKGLCRWKWTTPAAPRPPSRWKWKMPNRRRRKPQLANHAHSRRVPSRSS